MKYVTEYAQARHCSQIPVHRVQLCRWLVSREGVYQLNFDGSGPSGSWYWNYCLWLLWGCYWFYGRASEFLVWWMLTVWKPWCSQSASIWMWFGWYSCWKRFPKCYVVSTIQGKEDNLSCYGHLVGSTQVLFLWFHSSSVSHVYRGAILWLIV